MISSTPELRRRRISAALAFSPLLAGAAADVPDVAATDPALNGALAALPGAEVEVAGGDALTADGDDAEVAGAVLLLPADDVGSAAAAVGSDGSSVFGKDKTISHTHVRACNISLIVRKVAQWMLTAKHIVMLEARSATAKPA